MFESRKISRQLRVTFSGIAMILALTAQSHVAAGGEPTGPCCIANSPGNVGGCYQATEAECESAGNIFRGNGFTCADVPYCFRGACCYLYEGECRMVTDEECFWAEGVFHGTGSRCEEYACPLPEFGACCSTQFGCFVDRKFVCDLNNGTFMGFGTTCADFNCSDGPPPMGACCQADGDCVVTGQLGCERFGATYLGDNSTCDGCDATPKGACCEPAGFCVVTWEFNCLDAGESFHGTNTSCATVVCTTTSCACPGDLNGDSTLDGLDIKQFVTCILGQAAGSPPAPGCDCADVNDDSAADFADVAAFVARLVIETPCP